MVDHLEKPARRVLGGTGSHKSQHSHTRGWQKLFVALIPGVALAAWTFSLAAVDKWESWWMGNLTLPLFGDLAIVTYNAGCSEPAAGTIGEVGCDPFGRPYNYPPIWVQAFRALGVDAGDTYWLGLALVGMLLVALAAFYADFLNPLSTGRLALLTAATVSPPFVFLLIRGNTDLFVVAALALSAILLRRGFGAWAGVVLALAAGLKLHPAGAVIAQARARAFWLSLSLTILAIALLVVPFLDGIGRGTPSTTCASFGVGVVPWRVLNPSMGDRCKAWEGVPAEVMLGDQLIGWGFFALGVAAILRFPTARAWVVATARGFRASKAAQIALLIGAGPLLVTYLFTTMFDYKLFPLIFVIVACLIVRNTGSTALAVGAFGCLWLSYPLPTSLEWVGDVWVAAVMIYLAAVVLVVLVNRVLSLGARNRPLVAPEGRVGARPHAGVSAASRGAGN